MRGQEGGDQTEDQTTDGALLAGRLSYRQFRHGYRTGIEPVLLAAAVPARVGQRVLEAGCGAGAGMLCLCARQPGLAGAGVEADPATAALARHNWSANGLHQLVVHETRLPTLPAGLGRFDHVFANPPWHRANASASPLARRDLARRAAPGLLESWIAALAPLLTRSASLTLILPAASHAQASGAMLDSGFGAVTLLPLWPKAGVAAKIVLLQGRAGSAAGGGVLPGLVLHKAGGGYTEDADRVLRGGEALYLGL
ncbi:tRNA1(Val) (adenine(37)-N6)-methyltransferase [Lichenicoccus sp.]|uniref:tRNA1(Val) (adenine(37)-N6)-methyltransferase n=1 Tax=Lichenicoccus sp. TaxID=2781899 RepID=UPI003D10C46E